MGRKFQFNASFEVPVTVKGKVTINAKNAEEAKKLFEELISDTDEFCSHIRTNGDDVTFYCCDTGEILYEYIKRSYMDKVIGDFEDFDEEEDE